MKLSEILHQEEKSAKEILAEVGAVVIEARAEYGNSDLEIEPEEVITINGVATMEYLSAEDRLTMARQEFSNISMVVIEAMKDIGGMVLDKEIGRAIALSSVFINSDTQIDSEYI